MNGFTAGLFSIPDGVSTVDGVIEALSHLGLQWRVEDGARPDSKSAIAIIKRDVATGNIWAVAALQNNWATHHRHNNERGDYGEMIITLAGLLPDKTDGGVDVSLTKGTILYHAGGTEHQKFYSDFWVGLFNQPKGSTPLPG